MGNKFYIGIAILLILAGIAIGWMAKPEPKIKTEYIEKVVTNTDTDKEIVKPYVDNSRPKIVYRDKIIYKKDTAGLSNLKLKSHDSTYKFTILFNDSLNAQDLFPMQIDSTNLYISPAFDLSYKTIVETTGDTVNVDYSYPVNKFRLTVFPAPRDKIIQTQTIFRTKILKEEESFFKKDAVIATEIVTALAVGLYGGFKLGVNSK